MIFTFRENRPRAPTKRCIFYRTLRKSRKKNFPTLKKVIAPAYTSAYSNLGGWMTYNNVGAYISAAELAFFGNFFFKMRVFSRSFRWQKKNFQKIYRNRSKMLVFAVFLKKIAIFLIIFEKNAIFARFWLIYLFPKKS